MSTCVFLVNEFSSVVVNMIILYVLVAVCVSVCDVRLFICFSPNESPAGDTLTDQTLGFLTHCVITQHIMHTPLQ